MWYTVAFMTGLIGSLHCIGMCGPLSMLLPSNKNINLKFVAARSLYQSGRILTYALLGLLIGLIGEQTLFFFSEKWLSIGLGTLIILGLLLNYQLKLPQFRFVNQIKSQFKRNFQKSFYGSHLVFGMLNGLLPCGMVYLALTGSFLQLNAFQGAAYMALFGLGTVPAMMSVLLGTGKLKAILQSHYQRIIPITYALMAVLLIYRGLHTQKVSFHGNEAKVESTCMQVME